VLLPDDAVAPPFTDDDLDDLFAFEETESVGIDPELSQEEAVEQGMIPVAYAWQITSTAAAEWAGRKYAHTAAKLDDLELAAKEFHTQIDLWLARERKSLDRRLNFFGGHLQDWLRKAREDPEDGRKSIPLPSVTITSHFVPAKAEVVKKHEGETEEQFVTWARVYAPPSVHAKWSPVMAEVKKLVQFRTVVVPIDDGVSPRLFDVGDHLVGLPALPADFEEIALESLDVDELLAESHREETRAVWRNEDGSWWLVPGVVQVPGEVRYSVTPSKP
jgi:hypothetical protein